MIDRFLAGLGAVFAGGVGLVFGRRRRAEAPTQEARAGEEGDEAARGLEGMTRVLQKAVNTMSLGVTVTDLDGRILYVNPADASMHGYEIEELVGRNARVLGSPGPPPGELLARQLNPWARQRYNLTKDGHRFPVRLVSDVVYDDEGQPVARVTICEDISDRHRFEEALRRREMILEAVALASETFLAESAWGKRIHDVLRRFREATGVQRVQLRLTDSSGALNAEGLTGTWTSSLEAEPEDYTAPSELDAATDPYRSRRAQLASGRTVHGHLGDLPQEDRVALARHATSSYAVVPIFAQGAYRGYLSLESTRTDRQWSAIELEALRAAARTFGAAIQRTLARNQLATSEARYHQILESATDLIQEVSPDGRFQFVNRAWKRALGYTQEELVGLTLWDVVHPEHRESFRELAQRVIEGHGPGRCEAVFLTRDGREIALEGSLSAPLYDGRPAAVLAILRDISERRALDRMKQEFISTVSHELRTPLTSIIASLGLLSSGRLSDRPDRVDEMIAIADRNSQRLLQLISDLLDLQKLSAAKLTFSLQPVELAPLLEDVSHSIEAYAESQRVRIRVTSPGGPLSVLADRSRLVQVLNNLLSNAIKFSPSGAEVSLAGKTENGNVRITVRDHGPGIPQELQQHVFEKFSQIYSNPSGRPAGSGLGLSIAKGLVDGMGGRLELSSEAGAGCTFMVTLPLA